MHVPYKYKAKEHLKIEMRGLSTSKTIISNLSTNMISQYQMQYPAIYSLLPISFGIDERP